MVYKKYIKRGGKVFGPYYYESYRENGKVKTRFISGPKEKDKVVRKIKKKVKNHKTLFVLYLILIVLIVVGFRFFINEFYFEKTITGYAAGDPVEEWNASYDDGTMQDTAYSVAVDSSGNVYVAGSGFNILKYDSFGTLIWIYTYPLGINALDVAVDNQGDVYATGTRVSAVSNNYCTIKLDGSLGQLVWETIEVTITADLARGIAVDNDQNVYVTGYKEDDLSNIWSETIKYNSAGSKIWNVVYDVGIADRTYAITVDNTGNVYVTGSSSTGGDSNYLTIKYDSNGNEIWNVSYDGGGTDIAYGTAVDGSGNVYVTGAPFDVGDYYTIKYDSNGNEIWNARYDSGGNDVAYGIAVDGSGNVYVTGRSFVGSDNYYTIKYDSNGNEIWNVSYDGGNVDIAYGIDVDFFGNVYVTGISNSDYYTIKYSGGGGCTPDCAGKVCGDDGCGGSCGTCGAGEVCQNGQCISCTPDCAGKECGDDGCGGSCGSCLAGETCSNGQCISCTPDCAGKVCGDDGCGGSCGSCLAGETCSNGQCISCTPDCAGKECGDDGCGGSCGSCLIGRCISGVCVGDEPCFPDCVGKECGDDGCGGSCGICSSGFFCISGICIEDSECGQWTECRADYQLNDLYALSFYENPLLSGTRERTCNKDGKIFIEQRACDSGIPIIARRKEKCFEDYIEIYNLSNSLISRLEYKETINSINNLNIEFNFREFDYCSYCYDGIKNYDEDEVDCVYTGNSCPICEKEKKCEEILNIEECEEREDCEIVLESYCGKRDFCFIPLRFGICQEKISECGNNICENGEGDELVCPCDDIDLVSKLPCKAPCKLKKGTCPEDCLTQCYSNSDCPDVRNIKVCLNDSLCKSYISYICINNGTAESECMEIISSGWCEYCKSGCDETTLMCKPECANNSECSFNKPYCKNGKCFKCIKDENCDDSDLCTEDSCDNNVCINSMIICEEDEVCSQETGLCGKKKCPADFQCVNGTYCLNGECVECLEDSNCDPGYTCDNNICNCSDVTAYLDSDDDGFGNPELPVIVACDYFLIHSDSNFSMNDKDCNDEDSLINPNASEVCDGVDNDCDSSIDTDCECIDGTNRDCGETDTGVCKYGVQNCEGGIWKECIGNIDPAGEVCGNGLDDDCDNIVDEGCGRGILILLEEDGKSTSIVPEPGEEPTKEPTKEPKEGILKEINLSSFLLFIRKNFIYVLIVSLTLILLIMWLFYFLHLKKKRKR